MLKNIFLIILLIICFSCKEEKTKPVVQKIKKKVKVVEKPKVYFENGVEKVSSRKKKIWFVKHDRESCTRKTKNVYSKGKEINYIQWIIIERKLEE